MPFNELVPSNPVCPECGLIHPPTPNGCPIVNKEKKADKILDPFIKWIVDLLREKVKEMSNEEKEKFLEEFKKYILSF